ncbi:MAG: DRTGG domain-containing protein [Prolixibacteraceae bacterium]|nr:DRTGG domain-containing protein [Prolixibacteraceae bacterium]
MTIQEIAAHIEGRIVVGAHRKNENIDCAFASDLMSDVLTLDCDNILLITGLANAQAIRTAEMADIQFILLTRNKKASDDMVQLAHENGMVLMCTPFSLFKTSGLLYEAGLKPVY